MPLLEDVLASSKSDGIIAGAVVFELYDTYGFPPELVDEIGRREYGLAVDMDGFNSEMEAKRERDRAGHQVTGSMEIVTAYENLGAGRTSFDGYQNTTIDTRVLGILRDGEAVGHATRGQQVEIVLAETCFYAEGGGQVGDRGTITGPSGYVRIEDTQSPVAGLIVHRGLVAEGDIALGEAVTARVETERRLDASRNHSGTHLLHAALRSVLGPHVRQAGSLLRPRPAALRLQPRWRHDPRRAIGRPKSGQPQNTREPFYHSPRNHLHGRGARWCPGLLRRPLRRRGPRGSHGTAMTTTTNLSASRSVAAPHVHATGEVGTLVVLGESSIGGGMRRIEAMTGRAAEELFVQQAAHPGGHLP